MLAYRYANPGHVVGWQAHRIVHTILPDTGLSPALVALTQPDALAIAQLALKETAIAYQHYCEKRVARTESWPTLPERARSRLTSGPP